MTSDPMTALKFTDPARHIADDVPARQGRRQAPTVSRFAAVSLALALVVGGSAATVSAQALIAETPPGSVDIQTPAPGGTESTINVNSPQIVDRINQLIAAYPIPPGTDPAKVYAPVLQSFPLPPGTDFAAIIETHPRWASYFYSLHYQPAGPVDEGPVIPAEISDAGLSGTVALASVNAWYTYWLTATPKQKRASQPTLDAMQTWPDLTYRLGCQDEHTCPGGIIKIARIAQAAELGDPSPMKRWLDEFNNPTR
ncbi:MAG: hypothetical protein WA988_13340 [Candidatus Nanopelagicales bacterium]